MAACAREHDLRRVLGAQLHAAVTGSKVLVVGAGGIGCELLKNLVLSGFTDLHVIDLDTIDVSNLNRQFLFRKCHVDQPKSTVARAAILDFNPQARVRAFHDNVKRQEFGREFVAQFDLVFNALDNVSARKHVNRVCISTGTPLIESGSTGHSGQATVIARGESECYECTPKDEGTTTYPMCTVRSTPSKPVHCIEWGKELHKLLFGDRAESRLFEAETVSSTFMPVVLARPEAVGAGADTAALEAYGRHVFDALFHAEVAMKLELGEERYKGAEHKPKPLSFAEAVASERTGDAAGSASCSSSSSAPATSGEALSIYKVPSVAQNARAFVKAVTDTLVTRADTLGQDVWSKDVPVHLDFMTAAANLRAHVFSIPTLSPFKVKEIAGNIIPAIATTNAIVAGLQVLQAFQLLRHRLAHPAPPTPGADATAAALGADAEASKATDAVAAGGGNGAGSSNGKRVPLLGNCRYVFVQPQPNGMGRLLNPIPLQAPNPGCLVCGNTTARMTLAIDTATATLGDLVQDVLKRKLNFNKPTVYLGSAIMYDPDDEDDDDEDDVGPDLMVRVLKDLPAGGIHHGVEVSVTDDSQDAQMALDVVHHATWDEEEYPGKFCVARKLPEGFPNTAVSGNGGASASSDDAGSGGGGGGGGDGGGGGGGGGAAAAAGEGAAAGASGGGAVGSTDVEVAGVEGDAEDQPPPTKSARLGSGQEKQALVVFGA